MAKTRRHKTNRSPKIGSQNIKLFVVDQGARIAVKGHRTAPGSKMMPDKDAKPVFVGRVYTGANKGKVYPYASARQKHQPATETIFDQFDEDCIPGN